MLWLGTTTEKYFLIHGDEYFHGRIYKKNTSRRRQYMAADVVMRVETVVVGAVEISQTKMLHDSVICTNNV
ncbi:hypothetical protein SASPL_154946 [Salvia splendens]|uniref:Uncharacterized protein n=1 Tax=Salvia splendens TaxID=180675 RepID=A0A8X8W0Z5_SALSN|nr:hypothetical protein SASPL_154946 [Salvia splendens]